MKLIIRFVRFLVLSIFRLLIAIITTIFRLLVWPLFVTLMLSIGRLVSLSFRATVNGPTRFIDRLAGEWTQWFLNHVDDREHINQVFELCRFLIGATIVLGWVITGIFTYLILRVVFGYFI